MPGLREKAKTVQKSHGNIVPSCQPANLASVCVVWVGCQSFHKQAFNNLITWHSDLTNKPGVDNLISRTKFTFC